MPTLYLISVPIEENAIDQIPPVTISKLINLSDFIVERVRTSRRFIKKVLPDYDLDGATFLELNKNDKSDNERRVIELFKGRKDIGLMSESGSPCVADPGSQIVDLARANGYKIVPLSGPSSIILSLMASGLNGQQFSFHGYLPIKEVELKQKLKEIDRDISSTGTTHIFIETPHRNQSIYDKMLKYLSGENRLCVACNITSKTEFIQTKPIREWLSVKQDLEKVPTIFLLGK